MEWWTQPSVLSWTQLLLNSFYHWTGRELVEPSGTPEDQAAALFAVPFVVVSHGNQNDPILNYGNRVALTLWETTWERFHRTPSRVTAEPVNQVERERMLVQARTRGWINDYCGVRISMTGRRFLVEDAVVWNVHDQKGHVHGQAATFSRWTFL